MLTPLQVLDLAFPPAERDWEENAEHYVKTGTPYLQITTPTAPVHYNWDSLFAMGLVG